VDYLIIGAGPAGLQLGYFLERSKRDYLILETGSHPGTFFSAFPRHRQLISINKPHTGSTDPELNLRMDWNSLLSDDSRLRFARYSPRYFPQADDLVRYLADFAVATSLRIQYNTRVMRVRKNGLFFAEDERGNEYEAKRLIVASGVSALNIPDIPGIESCETYRDVSVDPADFVNQRVLIIGKGNSAFETADSLMESASVIHMAGPSSVRFAWRTHYVGHLRAVNNNFLDTYQLKSQNALLDGNVKRIQRQDDGYLVTFAFSRAEEILKDLRYDRVIVCTGFRFASEIFDESCRPELIINGRFPAQTPQWESTSVADLYFAGTLMQVRDYKKSTCGFIHGFRYAVRALHRVLEKKYEGSEWPCVGLPADPAELMEAVISRVNRTSALWQLFGFLCDVVEVTADGGARYLEELPVDYVHESEIGAGECYFTITLEYGPHHDAVDPFDISVGRVSQSNAETADQGQYLHPVVRRFSKRILVATHHVTENLENDWTRSVHREPLEAFLSRELAREMAMPA
jgi:thioredoxin reductase